ncbi:murein hydrolase activator EnvC family protein [Vibrio sp. RC27]
MPSVTLAAKSNELSGVKSEISHQQKELSKQTKKLDSLQSELKKQEVTISSIEKQIKGTQKKLTNKNSAIKTLEQEITVLDTQKREQSEKLKKLIDTYYITSHSGNISTILDGNIDADRISQYYQYLAQQRGSTIQALNQTHQSQIAKQKILKSERDSLAKLLAEQKSKHKKLDSTQSKRRSTLSKIKSGISSDKVYLAELQRNEGRLKAELAKAAKRNAVPMNGLKQVQGKLSWPVKGRLLHRFGTKQTGQIAWKGIVISANYGQQVKAAYPGTVVFSEYLRGYGLVVLLDHGKGDMTLYGFNQSLLKKEGDKITAGETIALVGDTGGQTQPSLYFEIRRNSKAQNPLKWLSK